MMENGNCTYTSLSSTFQSAWAQCGVNAGYWYQVPSVTASQIGSQMSITSTWNNVGSAPIYEPFAATWQLRNSAGTAVWSLPSAVDLQTVLPGTPANVTDAATINVAAGTYSLCLLVSDTSGIRKSPLSLGISGQASGGWYVLGSVSVAAAGGLGVSAPTLSITSPTSGSTVSGSVTISATETDSSTVNSVAFSIDGTTIATSTTAPYSCTWNTASVSNGSHAITAVLEDSAGNAANASAAVTVNNADTTPPTVSITSPANGATVSGTTAVKATASDSAGVASVAFSVDGTVKSTATTAPYSYSWVTTDVANGSHTVTATAKDTGGNTASSSVTVTVSNASSGSGTSTPTIAITSPGNEAVVSGTVAISAAVTDSDPVTSVAFVVDRVTWATFKSAPYTCQWNSKTHSNGLHYIQAVVTDADGRTATAAIHVVIDNN
jgi:hypothetical protein